MNIEDNFPPGSANRSDAPYNSDLIDCPECDKVIDELDICWYCGGTGRISEREYKEILKVQQQDFKANQ